MNYENQEFLMLYTGATMSDLIERSEGGKISAPDGEKLWFTDEIDRAFSYADEQWQGKDKDRIVLEIQAPLDKIEFPQLQYEKEWPPERTIQNQKLPLQTYAAQEYPAEWIEGYYNIEDETTYTWVK